MTTLRATLEKTLNEVLRPLLEADGGGIEIVSVDDAKHEVVLRFTGAFAVCPGTPTVREDLVEPLLRARTGSETTFKYQR
jgi:Fe-S cluster biogenesis protein NfuA